MITLVLQCTVAVCVLAIAVLSFQISRKLPDAVSVFRTTWLLAGVTFGYFGTIMTLQAAFAVVAFSAGPDHIAFRTYMLLSPIANHSRAFLSWPFYVALAVLAYRGAMSATGLRRTYFAIAASALLGGLYGLWEGTLVSMIHLPTTAIIDSLGFILLGGMLLAALVRDSLDRHLWTLLAIHGLVSATAAIFLAAMAWLDAGVGWAPSPWHLAVFRLSLVAAMVGIAAHRLQGANRGDLGRSMMPLPPKRSTIGGPPEAMAGRP